MVKIAVQSLVMGVRNTFEYSYMKCLYNKPNFSSKNGQKMHKIASTDMLNSKNFSGEIPRTSLTRGGYDPLSCSHPLEPSALAERLWRSIAVPLFKIRRRPCCAQTFALDLGVILCTRNNKCSVRIMVH